MGASLILAAAVEGMFSADRALAVDRTWTGGATHLGTGWSLASNWNTGVVPGNGDNAIIPGVVNLSDTTVVYDYTGAPVTLGQLRISRSNASVPAFSSILSMSANSLTSSSEYLGDTSAGGTRGRGRIDQSGGLNTTSFLYLGNTATDFGIYNLSNIGFLTVNGYMSIGRFGLGNFTESAGGVLTPAMYIGDGAGSNGTYTLSAGGLRVNSTSGSGLIVGSGGNGTFTQSGGNVFSDAGYVNTVYLGYSAGATGYYNLSAGTLSTSGAFEYVGYSGAGTFEQSGGANNLGSGQLILGQNAGSAGTYNLSGTGSITTGFLGVGMPGGGLGVFNQNGGTVFAQNAGIANNTPDSRGIYNLSAGSLVLTGYNGGATLWVSSGVGTFAQTGGTVSSVTGVTGAVIVGSDAGGSGTYTLDAGTISLPTGYLAVGFGGAGVFNQTSGSASISFDNPGSDFGALALGEQPGSSGAYMLSDGSLTVSGRVIVGHQGVGTFNQSGGTFTQPSGDLFLVGEFGAGTYLLSGGTLSAGILVVGAGGLSGPSLGRGTFTQTGGLNSANVLRIGSSGASGTYNLSAGSLSLASGLTVGAGSNTFGWFTQTGGTTQLSAGTANLYVGSLSSSVGTYTLSGTSALTLSGGNEYVGYNGAGTFIQSGGTNSMGPGFLILGQSAGSSGYYSLSGTGVVSAHFLGVGMPGGGSALFNQNGGTVAVQTLGIANNTTDARGTYNLMAGSLTLGEPSTSTAFIYVSNGVGTLAQTGGTVSAGPGVNATIYVGSGGAGTYTLSNGTINLGGATVSGGEIIGWTAPGAFIQTGGSNTLSGTASLSVGAFPGATGFYSLTGGTLSAANIYVGGTSSGAGGAGTFLLNTNTLAVTGAMTVWSTGTLAGAGSANIKVNLSGNLSPDTGALFNSGSLSVGTLNVNAGAKIRLRDWAPSSFGRDLVQVTGANGLTLAGAANIILNGQYVTPVPLISYAGNVTGSMNNLSISGGSAERVYFPVNDTTNHAITFGSKIVAHHTQIASEAMLAPGAGGGNFNDPFGSDITMNSAGQAAFFSGLVSSTDGGKAGIFVGDGTTLAAVARQKHNAPGTGGGVFDDFGYRINGTLAGPSINAAGQVGFESTLLNTIDGSTDGVFRYDPGTGLVALAREYQSIPGFAGQTLGKVMRFSSGTFAVVGPVSADGRIPFVASIHGSGTPELNGLFVGGSSSASLTTIARQNQAAPGTGGGTLGAYFGFQNGSPTLPNINASGQVAFVANLTGTSDSSTAGVFRGDGTSLIAIAREKQALPGAGGGNFGNLFNLGSYDPIAFNDAGQAAFSNSNITGTTDGATQGIFRSDGSSLVVIAREKRAAPGTGGGSFGGVSVGQSLFSLPVMNNAGQVGFTSRLTGTTDGSDTGVFRSDGSSLVAIARSNQAAPGTSGGRFVNAGSGGFGSVQIGPGGQVAFTGYLTGTLDNPSPNQGLFIGDGQDLVLAAFTGQSLPVPLSNALQGPIRTMFLGRNSVNQYGQVAYEVNNLFAGIGKYIFTPVLHWRNAGSGIWDNNLNWTLSLQPAFVHDVVIDPATNLTVTGPAANTAIKALTVGTGAGNASLQLGAGAVKVAGPLTIAGGSKIDLGTHELIYSDVASPADVVRAYLSAGYAGGAWTGGGLTSSAAALQAASPHKTALGYATAGDLGRSTIDGFPVASGDVFVKYTYSGDANLDGKVDTLDFNSLAANFGGTNKRWSQADFNFDGVVDTLDFNNLAANFGQALPSDGSLGAVVPEPGLLSALGAIGLAGLSRRSRRRRR